MLTPSYLFHATEPAEEIAERLHQDILDRIIERVMLRFHRGDKYILTATDKWNIETLQEAGYLLEDIQKEIAKATPYMQSEIAEAMEDAGVRALEYDDAIYRNAGLNPVPITQSPYLINIMQRDFEATLGEWKNFTGTLADAVQKTFIRACDTAYHQAMTGSISPAQAVREALEKVNILFFLPQIHKFRAECHTQEKIHSLLPETAFTTKLVCYFVFVTVSEPCRFLIRIPPYSS